MTPEQARQLLEDTTPGPWGHSNPDGITEISASGNAIATDANPKDAPLITAAPDMAAMIAGMSTEYAVQVRRSGGWEYSRDEDEFRWQDLTVQIVRADRDHPHEETRIVCRYVTEPQLPEEEKQHN